MSSGPVSKEVFRAVHWGFPLSLLSEDVLGTTFMVLLFGFRWSCPLSLLSEDVLGTTFMVLLFGFRWICPLRLSSGVLL